MTTSATISRFHRQLGDLSRSGQITHATNRVLAALASFLGPDGLFPAHEALALRVGCSVRTVVRALNRAYELGIVERSHHYEKIGAYWRRTSNRYRLVIATAERVKIAAKDLMRRVMKRSLSDRPSYDRNPTNHLRPKLTLHGPTKTRDEWLSIIDEWSAISKST